MHFSFKHLNSSAFTRLAALLLLFLSGSSCLQAQTIPAVIPVVSNGVEKLLPYVSTDASGYFRYRLAFDDKEWTVYYNNTLPTPLWEFQECIDGQCAILSAGTSVPSGKYPPYGADNWTVAGSYTGTSGAFAITGISQPASPVRQLVSALCPGFSYAYRVEFALGASYPTASPTPLVHLELSDVNGSFANPTELESTGSLGYDQPHSTSTIWFNEMGLTPGGNYKLRLRYYYTSYHYSEPFPLRIGPPTTPPVVTPVGVLPDRLCYETEYRFEHNEVPGAAEYQWTLLGSNVGTAHVTTSRSGNTITIKAKPSSNISALRVTAVNSCGQIFSQTNFTMAPNFAGAFIEGLPILFIDEPQPYRVQNLYDNSDITFNWGYEPGNDVTIANADEDKARILTAGPAAAAGTLSVDLVSPGCPAIAKKLNILEVKKRRQTVSDGAWGQPATWEGEFIPGPEDVVSIRHQVSLGQDDMILDQPVVCQEMRIDAGGRLSIEGGQLNVKQRGDLSAGQFRVDGGLILDGGRLLVEKHSMVMGNTSSWAMSGGAEVILESSETNIDFSEISGNLAGFTETGDGGKVIVRRAGAVLFQGNPGQHIQGHYQVGDGISRLAQDGQNFEIRAYAIDRLTLAPRVGSVNVYLLTAIEGSIQPFYLNHLTINKSDDPYISSPGIYLGYLGSFPNNRPSSLVISGNLTNYARLTVNPVSSGTAKLVMGGIPSPDGTTLSPTTLSTSITGNGEYSVNTVELMNQQGAVMSLGSNVTFTGTSSLDFNCLCYIYSYSLLINNATLNLHNYILKSGPVSGTGRIITGNGAPLTVNSGSSSSPFNVTFPVGTGADSFTPLSIVVDRNGVREIGVGVSSSFSNPPPTAVNVGVQWNISGGLQPPASATLTFTWREEDESAGFDRSSVAIARYNTDLGEWSVLASGLSAAANPDGSFSVSVSGVTHFSAWGVFDSESALPVNLVSFRVWANEGMADLAWQTTSESNARHFEIERSPDARQWNKIGQVAAKGESNGLESYSFTDPSVSYRQSVAGYVYYRLKMVDLDDSFSYSPIRSLAFKPVAETAAVLYPNPATDKVYLQNPEQSEVVAFVTMYSLAGNEVVVYYDKTTQSLNVGHLPAGVYLLQIHHKTRPIETRRVVIGR